jgi:putative ABC transport system permease protein
MRGDVSYAIRSLARSPGFTIAAILTLSIGIGATTAIYSVVNTILLQPLPYPNSDRLFTIVENIAPARAGFSWTQRGPNNLEFAEWRSRTKTLDATAASVGMGQRLVRTSRGTAGLWGTSVSGNLLDLLGARPLMGRVLTEADEQNPDVVVLSSEIWSRHFDGDPNILGRAIEFRAGGISQAAPRMLTVVGVMPASFRYGGDFLTPIIFDASQFTVAGGPRPFGVSMIGRLAPGVTREAATQEANDIGAGVRPPRPATAPPLPGLRFELVGMKEQLVRPAETAMQILLAAVAVVLLIVCANVANLLLARGTTRQREIAVRAAVGASRARIIRLIAAECAVLALAGGVGGAMIGAGGVWLVEGLAITEAEGIFRLIYGASLLPRAGELVIDWRVLATAFSLAAMTAIVCGLLPALQLSRTNHLSAMGTRGSAGGYREPRTRSILVVGQMVMATVLLVGAGLLAHSFVRLMRTDLGYTTRNILEFQLMLPDTYSVAKKADTVTEMLARLRALPGVTAAGFSRHGILIGEELMIGNLVPPGRGLEEMRKETMARVRSVSPGFITAIEMRLLRGREFLDSDGPTAPSVIVLNQSAAKKYFGSEDAALGQHLDWYLANTGVPMRVVGVVGDIRNESPARESKPEVFVDYRQMIARFERDAEPPGRTNEAAIGLQSFVIRTGDDPRRFVPLVREAVGKVDAAIGVDSIEPADRLLAASVARQRFYATVLAVFAIVAGVLAAIGINGVLAYSVAARTQEIGVRMALGAQRSQVLGLILRRGLALAAIGVALGMVAAAGAARYLQSMLFGIDALDPLTFAAVALGFTAIALLASYVPARRATRVEPVVALRCE